MVQLTPLHPKTPSSLASFKSRLVLPFWYRLIQVVLEKRPLNGCNSSMEYEVEGPRPRGRPKRTWREVVEKDCQARKLNKENNVDCSKWRKLTKDV